MKTKSLQAFIWSFLQVIGNGLITFLVGIYLARLLEPKDFGLIGMIAIFMSVGQSLIDSGLASSLIRTQDPKEEDFSTVFFINIIGSVLVYAACFFGAPFIANFYEQPILTNILRVYSLGFIIIALVIVQQTKMTKELDFKTQLKAQIPASLVSGIVGISLANMGFGVWSLVYMYLVNQSILSILFWYFSNWRPKWVFEIDRFKYHFNYGYKLTLSGIFGVVMRNSYYVVIGKFFSPTLLGFYTRAAQTKQLPIDLFGKTLNRVTFPLFSKMQANPKQLKQASKKLLGQVYFCLIPIIMGAIALATPLFDFLFTAKWLPAVPYFQLLCIVGINIPLHSYNLVILKVYGRSDLVLRLNILKQIMVAINIYFAIQYGIYGLLIGQIVMTNIAYFINTYYSVQYVQYGALEQIKDLLALFINGMLSMSIVHYLDINIFFGLSSFMRVLIGSSIGSILYLLLSILSQVSAYQDFIQLIAKTKRMALNKKQISV